MLLSTGFDVCLPLAASWLVDALAAPTPVGLRVWQAWAALIAVFGASALLRNAAFRLWIPVSARNMEELVNESHDALQRQAPQWHANQLAGATVRRIGRAMWGYDSVTDALSMRVVPALVVLLGLCAMLCWRAPCAGAIAFTVVGLFAVLNARATRRWLRPANLHSNALDLAMNGVLADALAGHATARAFAAERRESQRVAEASARWREAAMRTWRSLVDLGLAQSALLWLLLVGVTGAMLHAWRSARADAGDVAFAVTAFLQMSAHLRNFGDSVRGMLKGLDDVAGIAHFHRPRLARDESAAHDGVLAGDIVFEGVDFGYDDGKPVFQGLDLCVRAGETVLITGASGSGKSTLVKLLQGQYRPQRGCVRIGGHDIAQLPSASVRRAVAIASNELGLFHRTVRENIAYGKPVASAREVLAASRAAGAHAFIRALPEGYETCVGERGAKLSSGQVQRIALARALLPDAPILVLDEATSGLDDALEGEILARLAVDRGRQTRIVISHRPSTLLRADRHLVLQGGRLVEVPMTDALTA